MMIPFQIRADADGLIVYLGGGKSARSRTDLAKQLGVSEAELQYIPAERDIDKVRRMNRLALNSERRCQATALSFGVTG